MEARRERLNRAEILKGSREKRSPISVRGYRGERRKRTLWKEKLGDMPLPG